MECREGSLMLGKSQLRQELLSKRHGGSQWSLRALEALRCRLQYQITIKQQLLFKKLGNHLEVQCNIPTHLNFFLSLCVCVILIKIAVQSWNKCMLLIKKQSNNVEKNKFKMDRRPTLASEFCWNLIFSSVLGVAFGGTGSWDWLQHYLYVAETVCNQRLCDCFIANHNDSSDRNKAWHSDLLIAVLK